MTLFERPLTVANPNRRLPRTVILYAIKLNKTLKGCSFTSFKPSELINNRIKSQLLASGASTASDPKLERRYIEDHNKFLL